MIQRTLICVVLVLGFFTTPLFGAERISRFHSDIEVQADRSLVVTESIDVIAEHARIRHGIYRDLPTTYPHPGWGEVGLVEKTTYDLISVKVDGKDSPWHQESLSNGVRLYIGDPEKMISRGPHQYEIRYLTRRQIAEVGHNDILRWNVNGQGWTIPSDSVSATVSLPGDGRIENYTAWTGQQNSSEMDFQSLENSDGSVTILSTRAFKPKEGLTVLVWLPSGIVAARQGQLWRLIQDNFKWFGGMLLILLLPIYYFKAWSAVGRDPQKGVVVADFHPVRKLSPAAHRFITQNRADDTAFSAALINIAIKGYVRIEQMGKKSFLLHDLSGQVQGETGNPLTEIEKVVHLTLFSEGDQILLGGEYNKTVAQARKHLAKMLKNEWRDAVYRDNRRYSWFGLVVGVGALILCSQHLNNGGFEIDKLIPFGIFIFLAIGLTQRRFHFLSLLPVIFMLVNGVLQNATALLNSSLMIGLSLFVTALFVLFHYLLKAPTPFGQKILDEIEGFRLYLVTAEQQRLNILHPPDKTPQLFEKLLPYAIALGVEHQWGEQFAGILNRSTNQNSTYQPSWYAGDRHHAFRAGNFGSALGSGLASSIAAAATAPSSSSGGFSGGGAGSGGGGGGGGGW